VGKDDATQAARTVAKAIRDKGTKNSADRRRAKIAKRNQVWRDSGKTAKQIYLDQPDESKVSLSRLTAL
jgi:hypothetical protein